jgi:hypothetical protein
MTLVVDASIATKWFVEEAGREQALQILDWANRHAPDLIVAEVANVVWTKALRGQVTDAQARAICGAQPAPVRGAHRERHRDRSRAPASDLRLSLSRLRPAGRWAPDHRRPEADRRAARREYASVAVPPEIPVNE